MDRGQDRGPNRFLRVVNLIEDGILIVLLTVMIGFAVTQILLRNLFDTGIPWADPLLRILVLWVALAGAMVATRLDNHISIDILSRYLPQRIRPYARVIVDVFTALVCGVVAFHAMRLVVSEYAFGTTAFGAIPVWIAELIIPLAFGVIALRYAALGAQHGLELVRGH